MEHMLTPLALLRLLLAFAPALGGDEPTLVVRGGRVFDPQALALGAPCDLWIRGERVLGEKPPGTPVPAGVRTLDASGCAVLPGLFDLHVHVAVPGGGMDAFVMLPPEDNLRAQLYCGVVNVVDLHGDQGTIFALRERSRSEPDLARLFVAGAAFTAPGGHGTQFGIEANAVTTLAEVQTRCDALLAKKPDVVKAILEHGGWGPVPELPALDQPLLAAIAARAKGAGLPLFVHVWSEAEALLAARNGARALAHGVFVGKVEPALVDAMQRNGVAYIPTLAVVITSKRSSEGKRPYAEALARGALHPTIFDSVTRGGSVTWSSSTTIGGGDAQQLANLKTLADAGIEIGTGTDAGNPLVPHGPALLAELALFVEAGLTPAQALRAATATSAHVLGVDAEQGSLAAGKLADLVVVRGDPTRSIGDVRNVVDVVKAGVPVDRAAIAARNAARALPAVKKRAGTDVPARIDGFDDGDLASAWGGAWEVFTDAVTGQGKSSAKVAQEGGNLSVKGAVAQGFPWGAWAGASIRFDPEGRFVVDAAEFEGFRLRLRGTPRPYAFTVQRAAVKDFNVFSTALDVEADWKTVEIPFTTLHQVGIPGAKVVPWAADDFQGLAVDARSPFGSADYGEFELEIDWIELYRKE